MSAELVYSTMGAVCPSCGAKEGKPCYGNGAMRQAHPNRAQIARDNVIDWARRTDPDRVVLQEQLAVALETIEELREEQS